jgi:hypothetical protein
VLEALVPDLIRSSAEALFETLTLAYALTYHDSFYWLARRLYLSPGLGDGQRWIAGLAGDL